MSCILFSPSDYRALVKTPVFEAIWRDYLSYETPQTRLQMARAWWELNRQAYQDRYRETVEDSWDDTSHELEGIFARLVATTEAPLCWAYLWELLASIHYQCIDADNYQDAPAFRQIETAMHGAARRMANSLTDA